MPIIFEQVSYVYDEDTPWSKQALNDVDLRIGDGDFVGIIGPTGSGKSTLIQHMNGLLKPTSGRVIVNGIEVGSDSADMKQLRRTVGLVFQYPEHQLFEETLRDDIAFGPRNLELDSAEVQRRVEWACSAVGLPEDLLDRSPFELSGGQMRRAAIAGVLAMECDVLILDEPTAGLDPRGQSEILKLLGSLSQQGLTVIMVSHSIDQLVQLADRIVVMFEGRIILQGETREVFQQTEVLQRVALDLPEAAKIARKIKESGVPVSTDVLTIREAADAIFEVLWGDGNAKGQHNHRAVHSR